VVEVWSPERLKEHARANSLRLALVVTALDLELKAAMAHLAPLTTVKGRRIYESGTFEEGGSRWLCVVVESGMGTHGAQSAVTDALVDFTFEAMVFAGVGGSRKDDVPIGSVVAADHVYMPYGGKIEGTGVVGRPREYPADADLLDSARKVRRDGSWHDRIKPPEGGVAAGHADYPTAWPPAGHIAPIVSTESVVAARTGGIADIINERFGDANVIDMEGFGALLAAHRERTPAIVIRGVSDMARDKEQEADRTLQPVAASHAAAFAFELLFVHARMHPAPGRFVDSTVTIPLSAPGDAAPRSSVVINIDADASATTPERIAAIEAMLRTLTDDGEVTIMRITRGSLRLHVADPNGSIERLGTARLREELERNFLIRVLGMAPAEEADAIDALRADLTRASRDLLDWPGTLPDGTLLERPELETLLELAETPEGTTTVLLGDPGSGKSALLARLGRRLADAGIPVLAIKADLLDPSVADEDGLRTQLCLAETPGRTMERVAAFRPVFLLIDQLDALAGLVDLRTGRLNAVLNLVRRLGDRRNIHIVLSARRFEFGHDVRLRAVDAEKVELALPAWSDVLTLLEQRGVLAGGWPADAQDVMRSPQALSTYLQLDDRSEEPLRSYQAVLDRMWGERVAAGPNGSARAALATEIAETMSERETLWLPTATLDGRQSLADGLIASGVLVRNATGSGIGFSHQTLLDHAIARRFATSPGVLAAFVREKQASLFIRPKVWAALTYLRGIDANAYAQELEALWRIDGLRRHVRLLLLDFLGQQARPESREAIVMAEALETEETRAFALRAMTGSGGWVLALGRSHLADLMTATPETANETAQMLRGGWEDAGDEVERLVAERWLSDASNDLLAWHVIDGAPVMTPALADAAATILARTDVAAFTVEHVVSNVGAEQPDVAARLVRASLDRQLAAARTASAEIAAREVPPLEGEELELRRWRNDPKAPFKALLEGSDWDVLTSLAEEAPAVLLNALLPWWTATLTAIADHSDEDSQLAFPLRFDSDFRFDEEHSLGLPEHALLAALRIAAERLARDHPDRFRQLVANEGGVELAPVQRLIAHAFLSAPERYAGDALAFLAADWRRLSLGGLEDYSGTTTRLVRGVAPHWDAAQVAAYEQLVTEYRRPPPSDLPTSRRRAWRSVAAQTRAALLAALPSDAASETTRRTVEEDRRANRDRRVGVRFGAFREVGPIMDAGRMALASDDDILNAFRELPDAVGWDHPTDFGRGGNVQLARAFATFAKAHPDRATAILARIPPEHGTRAAGLALEEMAAELGPGRTEELVIALDRRDFRGDDFRASAARATESSSGRKKESGLIMDLLRGWLFEPVEDASEIGADSAEGEDEPVGEANPADGADQETRSPLWDGGGFGIVPGGRYQLLETMVRIHLARREIPELAGLIRDARATITDPDAWRHLLLLMPSVAPRGGAAAAAAAAAVRMVLDAAPGAIGSVELSQLIGNVHWWSPEIAEEWLERWRHATGGTARRGYGNLVALVALLHPERSWPAKELAALLADAPPDDPARAGVVETAAHLWSERDRRASATDLLLEALGAGGEAEWREALDLFRINGDLPPDRDTDRLLEAIADGFAHAPASDPTFIVDRLAGLLPHRAPLVARVAAAVVENARRDLADIRTGTAATAPELVDLAVTLHRLGPSTREAGLALFESLLGIDTYSARTTLHELDGRFAPERPMTRRRLPRRSGARRRRQAT
jgi:nucleoside phosphorylase